MEKQNGHNKKLESALDYSIKLLNSGASIEDCLKLYPSQQEELRNLLEIATSIQGAYPSYPEIRPSKLYMKTGREKFLAAIEKGVPTSIPAGTHMQGNWDSESISTTHNVTKLFRRVYVTVAAAAAAMIVAMGGLIGVSQDSLPGNPLYAVKRATESAQLALTFDNDSRVKLSQEFAQKRVAEVRLLEKIGSDSTNSEKPESNLREPKKLANASSAMKQSEKDTETGNEVKNEASNGATADINNALEAVKSSGNESGTGKTSPSGKVATNTDNSAITSGDAVSEQTEGIKTDRHKTLESKSSATEATIEGKSSAALPAFEVAQINVSSEYVNPYGNALRDKVSIRISGANYNGFKVELYKGSKKCAVIAEQSRGRDLEFTWNGMDLNGNKVEDGEYTIKAVDLYGQVASAKARIVVDTEPPKVEIVTPIDTVIMKDQTPWFTWIGYGDAAEYTLYLMPDDTLNAQAICVTGLKSLSYKPMEKLEPGLWKWRVVGTDKAGNVATSKINQVLIMKKVD